jgi:hypothetical protein
MPVTRSTNQRRVQVDHEIQNTLRRLRKEARVNTMVCVGMKPNGVDKEHVKLKAFPFSLKGVAKV